MDLPPLGTVGLYAVRMPMLLVKFGRTEKCLTRRLIHHNNNLRGLGMEEFEFAWVQHDWPRKAERDLKRRLRVSGFEPSGAGLETFYIGWEVAKRMLAAVESREFA